MGLVDVYTFDELTIPIFCIVRRLTRVLVGPFLGWQFTTWCYIIVAATNDTKYGWIEVWMQIFKSPMPKTVDAMPYWLICSCYSQTDQNNIAMVGSTMTISSYRAIVSLGIEQLTIYSSYDKYSDSPFSPKPRLSTRGISLCNPRW